jgi:uncharacterized protein (TIGR03437 family)
VLLTREVFWRTAHDSTALLLSLSTAGLFNLYCQPTIVAVVNAASFQNGLPPGGALVTLYVSGLSALKPGTYLAPPSQPLPATLGGVTVAVNNDYAPLLAVIVPAIPASKVQVNFQVPSSADASLLYEYFGAGPSYSGYISVTDGINKAVTNMTGNVSQWGGFFSDADGYAIAIHRSDSTPVTQQSPAHPGESIVVYADGFFLTWPSSPIAVPVPPLASFEANYLRRAKAGDLYLQAYIGPPNNCAPNPGPCAGSAPSTPPLKINSAGLVEGSIGVEEINFAIPSSQAPGSWALFFNDCMETTGIPGSCGG